MTCVLKIWTPWGIHVEYLCNVVYTNSFLKLMK